MARRPPLIRQRGVALLALLTVLVMATLAMLLANLTPTALELERQRKTQAALILAREALIAYAASFRDQQNKIQIEAGNPPPNFVYGYLPLPDLGTSRNTNIGCPWEGCDANLSGSALDKTVVGRFPWRLLGTPPLRDGYGECLWYAVSGSHQRIDKKTPLNWDTLGQIDVVIANEVTPEKLRILFANPHERAIALVFSPGPPLPGQNRAPSGSDDVSHCGGNYDPANYLEPNLAAILDAAGNATTESAYFSGATTTDTSATRIAFAAQGKLYREGAALLPRCTGSDCALAANDFGLSLAPDALFATIRKHAGFRQDINSLLDRIVGCLRDESAPPAPLARIGGADDDPCYGKDFPPINYYPHYKELLFVKRGAATVNGQACNGAVLFASERSASQLRATAVQKNDFTNYLEVPNLGGLAFTGPESFEAVSATQSAERDIVRCVPTTRSYTAVAQNIAGLGPLVSYAPDTRTLTLGQPVTSPLLSNQAARLYGCAWTPETHAMGSGLRSYFMFRINDLGFSAAPAEGFTFAIVDGGHNGVDACGAAGQHLGYSGDNRTTPFIAPPKLGIEIDPRRNGIFNPNAANTLDNGRNDPALTGGHVALVYWGGDSHIPVSSPTCPAPRIRIGSVCYLPRQEDDNVHGQPVNARAGFPAPPANPPASDAYKLDPNLSQVPVNRNFHVRVELTRLPASYALPTVRVASTGPLDLARPGSAIDGVLLFPGDRVLVKDQADAAENGLYVWNGAEVPMSRAADANSVTALAGLIVEVQQGALHAKELWRQQTIQPGNCAKPIECTPFVWLPAQVPQFSDLPAPASQPGRIVYVQKGDQGNGWFRSDGTAWQRVVADLAAQGEIDLSRAPASIDGQTPTNGSRILVRFQTNPAENGVYVWNGAGSAMTRATDFDSAQELSGALVQVLAGSDAGRAFRQTALAANGTLGSDAIQWTAIDPSPRFTLQVWILPDSATTARQIAAMQDTSRPMSQLYPGWAPQLADTPVIPYPFRNVRLGFTVGQRVNVTDQNFTIRNVFTTWLP
ncbi:MAG: hypothetical protein N3C63_00670 [Rhodocyclaceae bacterium]|nr:hypothetical protein [Rhodocyclaceae bacterium]